MAEVAPNQLTPPSPPFQERIWGRASRAHCPVCWVDAQSCLPGLFLLRMGPEEPYGNTKFSGCLPTGSPLYSEGRSWV